MRRSSSSSPTKASTKAPTSTASSARTRSPRISTIRLSASRGRRIGLGIGAAAIAQFLSFLLAGYGHGWIAPLWVSVGLWFLIPLTFAVEWPTLPTKKPVHLAIAAIAIAADALLVSLSLEELSNIEHLINMTGALGYTIIGLWLALWFCWQVLLLYALFAVRGDD